ncbi:MAG: HEAT repeat domain-containing protein [Candidatus Aminicenantes bacterium]|nr:HEAT repeat domain-containing protein [Candidatus Aminicenantes bacterium]
MKKVLVSILFFAAFCLGFNVQRIENASNPTESLKRHGRRTDEGKGRMSMCLLTGQKIRRYNMEHSSELAEFLKGYWREVDKKKGVISLYHFTGKKVGTLIEKSSKTYHVILNVESEEIPIFQLIESSFEDDKVVDKQHKYCAGEGAYYSYDNYYGETSNHFKTFKFDAVAPLIDTLWFYYIRKLGQDKVFRWSIHKDEEGNLHRMERITKNEYEALKNIMENRTVDYLLQALKDADMNVRRCAAEALIFKKDSRAVEPLMTALKDEYKNVRRYAAEALGEIGDQRAVEPLIVALKDENSVVRRYAAEALGKIKNPNASEFLFYALKDKDRMVRNKARWALERIEVSIPVEILIAGLKDEDKDVRQFSVEVLAYMKDPRAIGPLINDLKDKDLIVRTNAEKALVNIGDQAVEPLIVALKDENSVVRRYVAEALGEIGDQRAVEPLIVALKDEDRPVRTNAKNALVSIGEPAVGSLITILEGVDYDVYDVRSFACWALGRIKDVRSIEPLINALKDKYERVRMNASLALEKITGENFGQNHKQWRKWWKKKKKK